MGEDMRKKVRAGNDCAIGLFKLVELSLLLDILFWVEKLGSSYLFNLPPWKLLAEEWIDYCRFGAWRKRTKFLTPD